MIRVALAEDHRIVREGISALLARQDDFDVVGETGDGLRVAGLVERTRPDVLVADLMLPGLGGLEITRRLRSQAPRTRVVVLSMHSSAALVVQALRAGASAYVLKEASAAELLRAIREAVAGRRFLSASLSQLRITEVGDLDDPYGDLTPREREILQLTAEGLTSRETAERLGISPRTAEWHRAQIQRKLGFRGVAELTRFAVERGLLPSGTRTP